MSTFSSIYSAYEGQKTQERSVDKSLSAAQRLADQQIGLIREMWTQNQADMAPFLAAAQGDLQALRDLDIGGSAQKYMDQLEKLEFKFDENDPIYQWRQAENARQVNQFMASRGNYDSRAALNALTNSGMALQESEVARQFNQNYLPQYQKLKDLYAMGLNTDINKYGQLLDVVKLGTGAGTTSGAQSTQTANMISNVLGGLSQDTQNAILAQGAAGANMWNSVGQSANNAAMMAMLYGSRYGGGSSAGGAA